MENNNQNPSPSDSKIEQLKVNIQQQLHSGMKPDEVANQLRAAGWTEPDIKAGFAAASEAVMPTDPQPTKSSDQMNTTAPKRGRIKTGWLLFKQSINILKKNKMLTRYIVISLVWSLVLTIIFAVIFGLGHKSLISKSYNYSQNGSNQDNLTPLGFLVIFIYYILAYFIVNYYGAALAGHVLDLFHGKDQGYGYYLKLARKKAGTLFIFSLIEATIGLLLRVIAERSRILGRIIAAIVGTAWSIARLFVIPIIISSDESAVAAIKDSTKLLISTWGENIVGRVSMSGVLSLIFILVGLPVFFILFLILGVVAGGIGIIIGVVIALIAIIIWAIISTTATNILNTALFYYAKNRQIPAAFDADLINSVFIKKKGKGSEPLA